VDNFFRSQTLTAAVVSGIFSRARALKREKEEKVLLILVVRAYPIKKRDKLPSVKQNNYFVSPGKNKRSPICRLLPVFVFFGKVIWLIIHVFLHVYAEKRAK
jgi:hypothetical protein